MLNELSAILKTIEDYENNTKNHPVLNLYRQFFDQTLETIIDNYDASFHISCLLKSIYNSLKSIYIAFFENELQRNSVNLEQSFKNYIQFIKDFEITPYLLNNNQVAIYWKIMNKSGKKIQKIFDEKNEIGKHFTFTKFTLMILHFSTIGFNKINQNYYQNFTNQGKKNLIKKSYYFS